MNYLKAKELIDKQRYSEALKILRKYYKNSNNLEILFHFGKAYYYLKKYNSAYRYFVKSKNISDTNLSDYSHFYIAYICIYQKKFIKGLNILAYLKEKKCDINLESIYFLLLKQFAIYYQRYNFHKKHLLVIKIFENYIVNIKNMSSDLYDVFFKEFDKAIYLLGEKYINKKLYSKLAKFYLKHYLFAKKYNLSIYNKILLNFFRVIIIIQQKNLKISFVSSVKRAMNLYEKYKNLAGVLHDETTKKEFINISFENIIRLVQIYNQRANYNKAKHLYNKYSYLCGCDDFLGNKFLNEYEIATKQVVLNSKPRRYLIAVSNICDLKCIMCFQNKDKKKRYSLCANFFNIFCNNLKYAERITWQGGEPIIFPFFPTLLRECQKYPRIHNILVSNFQNVKEELFELLVNSNLDLTISIDGANKKTYEKIRVGAKFDKLINNIKKLQDTAKKFNKIIFLNLNFVIIKENYKEMFDILKFAIKYKFSQLSFIGGQVQDPKKILSDKEKSIVKKQFNEIKKLAKKHNIIVDNRLYFPPKKIIEKKDVYLDVLNKDKENKFIANNVPIDIESYKKIIKVNTNIINFIDIKVTGNDKKAKQEIEQNVKQEIKKLSLNKKIKYSKNIFCHLPWNELTVQYDNLIMPHCICNIGKKIDLTKIKNIDDIWNSEVNVNYRLKMLYNDVALCSGQCLVQHVVRNEEYHKPVINV